MKKGSKVTMTPAAILARQTNAIKHGERAERRIVPEARTQKRRLLRQMNLRASDVDGIGLALIDNWARSHAKVLLMDEFFAARGFVDFDSGEPQGVVKVYFTALNSARLSLTRLNEHMKISAPKDVLHDYIIDQYGPGGDA